MAQEWEMPSAWEYEAAHNFPREPYDPDQEQPVEPPPLPRPSLRVLIPADTVLEPPPAPDWIVDGVFARPSLNLLIGDPGAKKSLLATDLAASVALGLPWLGRATEQKPVIFVDEEAGARRLWIRLNAALTSRSAPKGTPLHFVTYGGYNFLLTEDVADLTTKALEIGAGLIVIDALADVMGTGSENEVSTMHSVFGNLRRLAHLSNCTVLVVHHTNKAGVFRGSSAISAGVDHMLRVISPPQDSLIKLRTLKARDLEPIKIDARASFEGGRFSATHVPQTDANDSSPRISLNATSAAILKNMDGRLNVTTKEILAPLPKGSALAARRVIFNLLETGLIIRINRGGRGRRADYMISLQGKEALKQHANETNQAA